MAHEMKDWIQVRVNCPDCGEVVCMGWGPGDHSEHLVEHGSCRPFRLGRKAALCQQLANAYAEEEREKLKRKPVIRQPGRRNTRQNPLRRKPVYEPERSDADLGRE